MDRFPLLCLISYTNEMWEAHPSCLTDNKLVELLAGSRRHELTHLCGYRREVSFIFFSNRKSFQKRPLSLILSVVCQGMYLN